MALDISTVELLDLIDVHTLQKIQDAFAKATGMAALTTDMNGAVTQLSNPTQFCMNLTRPNPVGCERCNQCDLQGGDEAARTGRPSVYYCHAGLMDFAAPIIVGGRHIGSLIGGQVLPEPADEEKIRKIAREMHINEEEYIRAIRKIKVMPKEQIENAANLLFAVADSLSDAGLQKIKAVEATKNLEFAVSSLVEEASTISKVMLDITEKINNLQETFETYMNDVNGSVKDMKKSDKIVDYIKDISMQLTLLGFNAAVEARKAGSSGAGINSVAQEIRRLSSETSTQTQLIDGMIKGMRTGAEASKQGFEDASAMLKDCAESINQLSDVIGKITELADSLKD